MAIIAITTSNSMSVKALTQSRSFGRIDTEEVLFDCIDSRCGARLAKFLGELVNTISASIRLDDSTF